MLEIKNDGLSQWNVLKLGLWLEINDLSFKNSLRHETKSWNRKFIFKFET